METLFGYKQSNYDRFPTYIALGSFLIGTLMLLFYLLFPTTPIWIILGFYYVMIAAVVNGTVVLHLVYRFCFEPKNRELLCIKILLLLANIPIAVLYFYIVIRHTYSN
ncbi:hypothetical protein [Flavobacterium sedimenticola]|uniref:Uncharacterized protein n=1 Tax=Flavobacterium sedimenticola TaxID=3043286 RepID=A0ABT6XNP9_9FLAO|nr:hypothetical protein [Flavobacterium sedimenticola]MDI9256703.1 hypothetical protein [Flavobacterium sedimenticola]